MKLYHGLLNRRPSAAIPQSFTLISRTPFFLSVWKYREEVSNAIFSRGCKVSGLMRVTSLEGTGYSIICSSAASGSPAADPELSAMMDSFRFLRFPKAPESRIQPVWVYIAAFGLAVIAAGGYLAYRLSARGTRQRAQYRKPILP